MISRNFRIWFILISFLVTSDSFALGKYKEYKPLVKQYITLFDEKGITIANRWLTDQLTEINNLEKEISFIYYLSWGVIKPEADFLELQKKYLSFLTETDENYFKNKSTLLKIISKSYYKKNELDNALTYAKKNLKIYKQLNRDDYKKYSEFIDALNEVGRIYKVQKDHENALPYYEQLLLEQKHINPGTKISIRDIVDYLADRYARNEQEDKLDDLVKQHRQINSDERHGQHLKSDNAIYSAGCFYFLAYIEYEIAEKFCKAEVDTLKAMYKENQKEGKELYKSVTSRNLVAISAGYSGNYVASLKGQGKYNETRLLYQKVINSYNIDKKIDELNNINDSEFFNKNENASYANHLGMALNFYIDYAQFEIKTARYGNAITLTKQIQNFLNILDAKAGEWGESLANSYWHNLIGLQRAVSNSTEWVNLASKLLGDDDRLNNKFLTGLSLSLADYYNNHGEDELAKKYVKLFLDSKPLKNKKTRALLLLDKINKENNADSIHKKLIKALQEQNENGSNQLVVAYNEYGLYLKNNEQPEKAEKYYRLALDLLINGNLKYSNKKLMSYQVTRNLFFSLFDQGKYKQASEIVSRELVDVNKGDFNLRKKYLRGDIGKVAYKLNDLDEANTILSKVYEDFKTLNSIDQNREKSFLTERRIVRNLGRHYFSYYLSTLWKQDPIANKGLSFQILQDTVNSLDGIDLNRGKLKNSFTKDSNIYKAIEHYHDKLAYFYQVTNTVENSKRVKKAISGKIDIKEINKVRDAREELQKAKNELDQLYPEYLDFTTSELLSPKTVKKYLNQGELLVSFLFYEEEGFVWAIDQGGMLWERIDLNKKQLNEIVERIRINLEIQNPNFRGARPVDIDQAGKGDINQYLLDAFELYVQLFGKIRKKIESSSAVVIVGDGALKKLPFNVLVTEKPNLQSNALLESNSTKWFGLKKAMFQIPSIGSIKTLRGTKKLHQGSRPFVGFGDPEFKDLYTSLKESADEINSIANSLGAESEDVYLQSKATESNFKNLNLGQYNVIVLATHGLLPNQNTNHLEPALVLTHPEFPDNEDDGLLESSEIAQLNINANWVILSACNTGAENKNRGFSGFASLAKSFLFAGAESVLVSHWPVLSDAAVKLTTKIFDELKHDPAISHAEALRRSMQSLIKNESDQYIHPRVWAPFFIVGEGG